MSWSSSPATETSPDVFGQQAAERIMARITHTSDVRGLIAAEVAETVKHVLDEVWDGRLGQ